jgi:hypothetical protein
MAALSAFGIEPSAPGAARARPGRAFRAAVILAPVLYGLLSLWLGQDANWDLRNYHFYNPYAFLNGRLGFDVAVAHHATYYNPFSDLPFYLLVTTLPPRATGFILGAVHGLNFVLLAALAWRLLATAPGRVRDGAAVGLAALGMLGGATLSEVGTTFHDNFVSLFTLGALTGLVLSYRRLVEAPLANALAFAAAMGLLSGFGAGLKQTAVILSVGVCAGLLFVTAGPGRRFLLAFTFGLGVLAGIALGGGYWMWELWRTFGNPLFPYYNDVFKSPWADAADYLNRVYLPASWFEVLFYPLVFAAEPFRVSEIGVRDLRLPLLYALALAALLLWPFRRLWAGPGALKLSDHHPGTLVLVAAGAAYLAWLKMFGVYRYLVPLEMLAPVLILLIADRMALPRWAHGALLAGMLAAALATVHPGSWGRAAWSDDYFGVRPPPIPDPANSIVVMAGTEPLAYAIPFFPPEVPFLRIEGWFTGPSERENGTDRDMRRRIGLHAGPLYAFFRARYEHERTVKALAAYGLKLRDAECVTFKPHIDIVPNEVLAFCPLDRL